MRFTLHLEVFLCIHLGLWLTPRFKGLHLLSAQNLETAKFIKAHALERLGKGVMQGNTGTYFVGFGTDTVVIAVPPPQTEDEHWVRQQCLAITKALKDTQYNHFAYNLELGRFSVYPAGKEQRGRKDPCNLVLDVRDWKICKQFHKPYIEDVAHVVLKQPVRQNQSWLASLWEYVAYEAPTGIFRKTLQNRPEQFAAEPKENTP